MIWNRNDERKNTEMKMKEETSSKKTQKLKMKNPKAEFWQTQIGNTAEGTLIA